MKILVIMKRFGANKDMVMDDFGRQIRLFENLAGKHKIDFFCPDYTKKESKVIVRKKIRYIIKPVSIFSLLYFYRSAKRLIKKEKYDVIVASTDPLIGILGYQLSKKYRIPFIYDLQDNFEIYDSYRMPFVKYFDRKAIKTADVVLAVSESLKEYISKFRKKPTYVIQNGIDLKLFRAIDKKEARRILKLPLKAKILIYIGEISRLKGADVMLEAFEMVKKDNPDTYLLLSGKVEDVDIKNPNIIYRKLPKTEEVVAALNASDVLILPNPKNKFSEYCFPYKILEYMSCNRPVVATRIGDVGRLLKRFDKLLCNPNDSDDLHKRIMDALKIDKINYREDIKNLTWIKLSEKLSNILRKNFS
jgi:teichuronic acid biosynthesis glycosyltransferase TuaC